MRTSLLFPAIYVSVLVLVAALPQPINALVAGLGVIVACIDYWMITTIHEALRKRALIVASDLVRHAQRQRDSLPTPKVEEIERA
jgi:hypothetical protein